MKDQLVTVSSSKAGVISASRMSDRSVGGVFDLQKMTLGSYPVTAGVHVFERVSGSTVVQLELADIQAHSIPGDKIATYHLNSSDMVDFHHPGGRHRRRLSVRPVLLRHQRGRRR